MISDYFKRSGPSTSRSNSSSSTSHKTSQNKPLPQSSYVTDSGTTKKDSLSEEKILQVLSECDRLIEGQQGKERMSTECFSTNDDKHVRDAFDRGVSKSEKRDTLGKEGMKRDEKKDKVSQSTSESSRLLSVLDEIDSKVS